MNRRARTLFALACAFALAACGAKEEPQAARAPVAAPAADANAYNADAADLDRPCTLMAPDDARRAFGQSYYRTMVADRVEDDGRVRCARGVGVVGITGVAEAAIVMPADGSGVEATYIAMCREEAPPDIAPPATTPPAAPAAPMASAAGDSPPQPAATPVIVPVAPPPPPLFGRTCRLAAGGYAILMADRVLIAIARGPTGEFEPEASLRLASILSQRFAMR